jgi:thiamine monophosphate synthase
MNIINLEKYIFIDRLNEKIKKEIIKLKKIRLIYSLKINNNQTLEQFLQIVDFSKKNKIPLYYADNYKIAIKYKIEGIFLTSQNKRVLPTSIKNRLKIIGSAHNQREYFTKKNQTCEMISLSPLFYNNKYSVNKILQPLKFNLITNNWKVKICALGGILETNKKKVQLTKATAIGIKRFVLK